MFEIDDIDELYALQKGLTEIRFKASDVDWAVQGSPILGRLHERILESIIAHHEASGEPRKAEEWRKWRRFETREFEWASIRRYLRSIWSELSPDEKRAAVVNQMRPFTCTENDVSGLISELDSEATA